MALMILQACPDGLDGVEALRAARHWRRGPKGSKILGFGVCPLLAKLRAVSSILAKLWVARRKPDAPYMYIHIYIYVCIMGEDKYLR